MLGHDCTIDEKDEMPEACRMIGVSMPMLHAIYAYRHPSWHAVHAAMWRPCARQHAPCDRRGSPNFGNMLWQGGK